MPRIGSCPICGKPAPPRPGNPAAPFCSERCRLLDLGKWLGGDYRIPGPSLGDVGADGEAPASGRDEGEDER
ncbi:MAG TPA: DNA gyrase inhibitor YacG [Anaeromyxobacteraceae bacterium]|nr:DNA gyrase inhibitor YacG [Anaeromyxobacteraceae bacterium]